MNIVASFIAIRPLSTRETGVNGRTDRRPENIMPPPPTISGGIKYIREKVLLILGMHKWGAYISLFCVIESVPYSMTHVQCGG